MTRGRVWCELERFGLGYHGVPLSSMSSLRMSAVNDRLPPQFLSEPSMVLAQVTRDGHRPAPAAIAKPRGAQRVSMLMDEV